MSSRWRASSSLSLETVTQTSPSSFFWTVARPLLYKRRDARSRATSTACLLCPCFSLVFRTLETAYGKFTESPPWRAYWISFLSSNVSWSRRSIIIEG